MFAIWFGADALRSLGALVTESAQFVAQPIRAFAMKVLVHGVADGDRRGAVAGALVMAGATALQRLMEWASFNIRMRLRENTQLHLDARLMALVAGIPGLEHHERPDVLMQHGDPSWAYLYPKVIAPVVAAGLRAVAPDLVGFGRSDKPVRREDEATRAASAG
jgi:hypothetical protein